MTKEKPQAIACGWKGFETDFTVGSDQQA